MPQVRVEARSSLLGWAQVNLGWHAGPILSRPIVPSQSALWDSKLPGPRGCLQERALLSVRHLGSGLRHVSGGLGPGGGVGQGCTGGARCEQKGACKEVRTGISKYGGGSVVAQAHEGMYVTDVNRCVQIWGTWEEHPRAII